MGTITVSGQLTTFALSMLFGILYSLLYDVFKTFHLKISNGFWPLFFSDVLYSFILLICTYSFLLIFCNGRVRAYVVFGNALGFAICRLTLSKLFIKICFFVVFVLKKILMYSLLPFCLLSRLCKEFYKKTNVFIKDTLKKLFKKKQKHLERDNINGV